MISIEINRYTIMKLEQAIIKYNTAKPSHFPKMSHYAEILNHILDDYLRDEK